MVTEGPELCIKTGNQNTTEPPQFNITNLQYPRMCQMDENGSTVFADTGNDRVLMWSVQGGWSILDIDFDLRRPVDARLWNGQVYVIDQEGNRLRMCYA